MTAVPSSYLMRRVNKVYFVGIGGVGMSGIAEVMLNLGYRIYGSDLVKSRVTDQLTDLGATIEFCHDPALIKNMDVVVVSSAIEQSNPQLLAAQQARIPIVRRAEMLAELMRFRHGIAVAGTHGKTTTTSLIATVLAQAGLDPTFIVGGRVNSVNSHSKLGAGQYLVAEADESDASFLHLQPMMAVVTNIDADHMLTYEHNFDRLKDTFLEFLHHLPFYGLAILCLEDEQVRSILQEISRPVVTYGLSAEADVWATDIRMDAGCSSCVVHTRKFPQGFALTLNMPGEHNILNALASIAIAEELDVAKEDIVASLASFQGIGRRMQQTGTVLLPGGEVILVDDYAHHPRELKVTFAAVRQSWREGRLIAVFQPHRYTRTRDLFDDFVLALEKADVLILLDVYAAGEKPIANADSRALSRSIRLRGKLDPLFIETHDELVMLLAKILQPGDVVLTVGAGNIGALAATLPARLTEQMASA